MLHEQHGRKQDKARITQGAILLSRRAFEEPSCLSLSIALGRIFVSVTQSQTYVLSPKLL